VSCYSSVDGKIFKKVASKLLGATTQSEQVTIKKVAFTLKNINARYIRIVAKKLGKLPSWHLGYKHDGRSWMFADEIEIK